MTIKTLVLYGSASSREMARLLLENLPQVRRVDADATMSELRLLLSGPLQETSLIPLLSGSGIDGFRLA